MCFAGNANYAGSSDSVGFSIEEARESRPRGGRAMAPAPVGPATVPRARYRPRDGRTRQMLDPNALTHHRDLVERRASVGERVAAGKRLRKTVPRRAHGEFQPAIARDPLRVLETENVPRLPGLVPVRTARMLVSPFAFLRGGAGIMAADLAPTPTTGITVQACGDMHLSNFGFFGSAERNLIFAINDFDETLPGPWEWDLKRLVASVAVCARHLGGDAATVESVARAAVESYRTRMQEYAELGYLATWYARIDEQLVLDAAPPEMRAAAESIMTKARRHTHLQVLGKLTDLIDDRRRILEEPPLVVRETVTSTGRPIAEAVDLFLRSYLPSLSADRRSLLARYRIVDVARKVVGVGSVGTRCWVVFMEGSSEGDPLFLQVKEANASVLAPYVSVRRSVRPGRRVVDGQRLIQGAPDIFLGWGEQDGMHFYVRQLRDMKGGVEFTPERSTPGLPGVHEYIRLCGWALALAHAKSGDAAMIAGYVGRSDAMDEALAAFALAYADQTERDHQALVAAVQSGRFEAATGL